MDDHRYAILDVSNIAYAHWFVTPAGVWKTNPTALFLAMAKSCRKIQEDLAVDTLAFAFDGGSEYRKGIYPEYKGARKAAREGEDPEITESREMFFEQIRAFRERHLPDIGAKNVFYQRGCEADDLIAAAVKSLPNAKKVYVVSSDEDMYQCIEGNRVVLYKPVSKLVVNESDFRQQHKDMPPCLYASAKAWAGCSSDNIPGLAGIGIIKASQFVMGKTKNQKLFHDNLTLYNRNILLTRLPAPGTPKCEVVQQDPELNWGSLIRAMDSANKSMGKIKQ